MTSSLRLIGSVLSGLAMTGTGAVAAEDTAPTTYRGLLSFGGTVTIAIDAPGAGKVQLRFDEASPHGLHGAIVGSYMLRHGEYVVRQFKSDPAAPPPDKLLQRLRRVSLTFTRTPETLGGSITGLPNLSAYRTAHLAGAIHATSAQALPDLASLAGVYTFLRHRGTYSEPSGILRARAQTVDTGQIRIDPAGIMRTCSGRAYAEDCNAATGVEGRLVPADQTRWPGALQVMIGDKPAGRLFVAGQPGNRTLYFAEFEKEGSSLRIGTTVMRTAQPVAPEALTGRWRCQHPKLRFEPASRDYLPSGSLRTETLAVTATDIDNKNTGHMAPLWRNTATSPLIGGKTADVNGLGWVRWHEPFAPEGWPSTREQAFLPLDANTLAFLLQPLETSPLILGGICHRQPVAEPKATAAAARRKDQ